MHSRRFSLFGHTLTTGEDLSHSLQSCTDECGNPDSLRLLVKRRQRPPELKNAARVFPTGDFPNRQPASLHLYTNEKILRIVYLDFASYDLSGATITCYPENQASDRQLHLNFLGPVISMWLERNGYQVLHASAVLIDQQVALFLGDSRQGKSTVASSLVSLGHPLISDDLVPVKYHQDDGRFYVYPSYPVIKLWPDHFHRLFKSQEPSRFMGEETRKCRIRVDHLNPDLFCPSPRPLSLIYKLCREVDRADTAVQPLSGRETMLSLVRYSFAAPVMLAMRWQAKRLDSFTRLGMTHWPMREFNYPSDTGKLDLIAQKIVSDVNNVMSQDDARQA